MGKVAQKYRYLRDPDKSRYFAIFFLSKTFIICSKTRLDGTTHEQTIILLAVICIWPGGLSVNGKEGKTHASNNNLSRLYCQ